MRRLLRSGLVLWFAAGIAIPAPAFSEESVKPARLGYVWIGAPGTDGEFDGLRQGLAERGYVDGRNMVLERRYADDHPDRLPALITELLALNVDVLITPGSQTTHVAQRLTSAVPIVSLSGDPVGAGLVASLAHPGGNVTGLSLLSGEYSEKWLELLKEALPNLHRVAVLWNPDNPSMAAEMERMRKVAPGLGLELTAFSARPAEIDASLAAVANAASEGLVIPDDPFFHSIGTRLVAFAAERRLPAIYGVGDHVRQGGLMSYSSNLFDVGRRAAVYVDRILKGARPSDLPIEQATEFSLRINLKTAKALGIEMPPSLLTRADEVIE